MADRPHIPLNYATRVQRRRIDPWFWPWWLVQPLMLLVGLVIFYFVARHGSAVWRIMIP